MTSPALRDALAALEPFAKKACCFSDLMPDNRLISACADPEERTDERHALNVGDLRNAAKAYESLRANSSDVSVSRERTPQDFAIEFAEYMAKDAEAYMLTVNETYGKAHITNDVDFTDVSEAYRGLVSGIYEFRKRADRANAMLSASPQAKGEGDGTPSPRLEGVTIREFADVLRKWWSFDDGQRHTHTWHSREDFIEKMLPPLLASALQSAKPSPDTEKVCE